MEKSYGIPTRLTRTLYDAMVAACRAEPGNAAAAARRCGVDRRMMVRAWEQGYLNKWPWAHPIKEVLRLENESKAAELQAIRSQEIQKARAIAEAAELRAAESAAREAESLDKLTKSASSLSSAVLKLAPAVEAIAEEVAAKLANLTELKPAEGLAVLESYSKTAERVAKIQAMVMDSERLRTSRPTSIVEHRANLTVADVEQEHATLGESLRAFRERKARGPVVELDDEPKALP